MIMSHTNNRKNLVHILHSAGLKSLNLLHQIIEYNIPVFIGQKNEHYYCLVYISTITVMNLREASVDCLFLKLKRHSDFAIVIIIMK